MVGYARTLSMWRSVQQRVGLVAGFLLVAGLTAVPVEAGEASPETAWLTRTTRELLQGCQSPVRRRHATLRPDGKGNYRALWTRDFAYMVEHAGT